MFRLGPWFVENVIHDGLVNSYFPSSRREPVFPGQLINRGLLESALAQPFLEAYGQELYPTFEEKAARLLYGLAASHPFLNGNKRTAAVTLDLFCYGNDRLLTLEGEALHDLVVLAASHNERGIAEDAVRKDISSAIRADCADLSAIRSENPLRAVAFEGVGKWVRQRGGN